MNKERYLYSINKHTYVPQGSIDEIDDEEESNELPSPFYCLKGRFYHFDKYNLLEWFLMCDYEVIEFEDNNKNMFALLKRNEERVYIFTFPDEVRLKKIERDKKLYDDINCYSSFVFYNVDGKIKLWRFEDVNELFIKWLKEYVNHLLNIPSYIR